MGRVALLLATVLGGVFLILGLGSGTAWAQGEAFKGTIKHRDSPLQGVRIAVATEAGQPVGQAATDENGKWRIDVPGPGRYRVILDQRSLPPGLALKNPQLANRVVRVFEGNPRTLVFPLVERAGPGEGDARETVWERRLKKGAQLLFEGFNLGLIIALAAVGLSLVFGTTGLTNFSHGELVTLGGVLTYFANVVVGLPFLLAAPLAVVACGAFGYFQDRFFWGRLRATGVGLLSMMIISIGLAILLRYVYLYFYGGRTQTYNAYVTQGGVSLGPISATPKSLVGIVIEIVVLVAVGLALLYTRMGKATRAVADNPALADSSGIDVNRVVRVVWTAGAAIAGLAGLLLGLSFGVHYQMGFGILLLIFAGVILGGLGTAFGALLGSLVVGMFIQLSTLVIPAELKNAGALLVLIFVLLFRPQGILGRRERVG